jgi:glycosyltransferase involved in cell wall biosynthesis
MKFSIITICYNPGDKIKTAIESVVSQDYSNIEYIIIDGASTDGTAELVKSYGDKINKFVSEPDKGLYDALNKGINLATGDVIGFVNADDLLAGNNVISDIAMGFDKTAVDGLYGDLEYVAKDDTAKVIRYWQSGNFKYSSLRAGWMPPHPTLYLKRSVYQRARLDDGGYFDTSFKIAADYDFMMRVLGKLKVDVTYLPQVLVKMRLGGKSNKNISNIIQKSREDLTAMRRNGIGGFGTLIFKNFRKLPQFIMRK